jgi:hypothetical protein
MQYSVGIVTRMWVRRQKNHGLIPSCNKRVFSISVSKVTTSEPQGVNLPMFEVNLPTYN